MVHYDYLVPFKITYADIPNLPQGAKNTFLPVESHEMRKLESYLSVALPGELKDFYDQIGYGFLKVPQNPPPDYTCYDTNRINDPLSIIDMMSSGEGMLPYYYEEFLQGTDDIPIFEMYDSEYFMHMKPKSDNPNAVWYCGTDKIEDSFERFIYNLYHDAPDYYSRNW